MVSINDYATIEREVISCAKVLKRHITITKNGNEINFVDTKELKAWTIDIENDDNRQSLFYKVLEGILESR